MIVGHGCKLPDSVKMKRRRMREELEHRDEVADLTVFVLAGRDSLAAAGLGKTGEGPSAHRQGRIPKLLSPE